MNHGPRGGFVRELFGRREEYNAFHEYYQELVKALYEPGCHATSTASTLMR